ncbi:MAG: HAMP domain-containing protein, partial [bacterium]|nr:HAMP domain-containing protein [bacterium]
MTLRTRILVYLVVMHVVFAAIAVVVIREHWLWLVVVDALFLISILVAYRLTRSFLVPLELIRTGAELIREGDFSSHFRPVGQQEMDALVEVYNRMIDQLRSERLRLREQGELFDQVVTASPAGVVLCDLDRSVSQLNPSAEALLGGSAEELLGRRLADLDTPVGRALAALATGASRVVPLADGRRLRCRRAEFRDRGFARSFYLLEELTEELRQSEKSAYEKLIRMMSHEVNNSVAAVGSLIAAAGG